MISIIVAVKDCRDLATACLDSLVNSVRVMGLQPVTEFIFIDDASRTDSGIPQLFQEMRRRSGARVCAIRFRKHQHYTFAVSTGLSLARGSCVIFFSHDMIVAPACLGALLRHADSDRSIGIIRPVSQHMDLATPMQIAPPFPPRNLPDVCSFARCVAECGENRLAPQSSLIGDAMLIGRRVIDAIGVMDTRFVGFMGDLDYGLRARHAGFVTAIARDAWLHHWGAAASKEAVERQQQGVGESNPDLGLPMIHRAFARFRDKWGGNLPPEFTQLRTEHFEQLAALPRPSLRFALHEPPFALNPVLCEEL